jgi:hypothetical protein
MRLLGHVKKESILRMHALSRHPKTIPANLLPISNISPKTNTGEFFYPPVPELQKYTVLVVTLVTAGTRTRCVQTQR